MADEEDETMSASLTFRLTPTDLERLARVAGPVPRGLVARAAMMVGLEAFERDPGKVMRLKPAPRGPRPKRGRKTGK